MIRLLVALVAVAAALSLSPAAPVPKGAERNPVYHPTRAGDRWVYWDGEYEIREVVIEVNAADGRRVVTVRCEDEDGLAVGYRNIELSQLAFPGRPGDVESWTAAGGVEIRKVTGPEKVTVPAGTFEAIRVEWWIKLPAFPDPISVKAAGYAQGVGLIKSVGEIPNGDGYLKSFSPGKD